MKRKVSEILFFIQGGVIFFLIGFLIVMNCMDYALPYVWTCVTVVELVGACRYRGSQEAFAGLLGCETHEEMFL